MKKQNNKATKNLTGNKNCLDWKKRRALVIGAIPLEVDLENRQLFFDAGIEEKLRFNLETNNIDSLIKTYLDPKDLKKVTQSLSDAKEGLEKPIHFNFIHPITSRSFKFEYRYQIIYVKYASTRLHGELIKVNDKRQKTK